MKQLVFIIAFVLCCLSGLSQNEPLERMVVHKVLIDSGIYKNYYQYNLGNLIVYDGIHENNLKFLIVDRNTSKIIYTRLNTPTDAMILKPQFFENTGKNRLIIIMLEVAAEYSWGQEIILIKNGKVFNPGYLNYATDEENGTSIADHSHFIKTKNSILLTFDDVHFVNWDNEDEVISGRNLKFEITEKRINKK